MIRPFLSGLTLSALRFVRMRARGKKQVTKRAENCIEQCVSLLRGLPNTSMLCAALRQGLVGWGYMVKLYSQGSPICAADVMLASEGLA